MGGLCFKQKESLSEAVSTNEDEGSRSDEEIEHDEGKMRLKSGWEKLCQKDGLGKRTDRHRRISASNLARNVCQGKTKPSKRKRMTSGRAPTSEETPDNLDSLKVKALEIFALINSHDNKKESSPGATAKENSRTFGGETTSPNLEARESNGCDERTRNSNEWYRRPWNQKYRCVKYIKKVQTAQPKDSFTLLDEEMSAEVGRSMKFMREISPFCGFLISHIQSIARTTFSDENVVAVMYGSMATGFVYEGSDMDLALCGVSIRCKEELDERIELLGRNLRLDSLVLECQTISTARVPVIKLKFNLEKIGNGTEKKELRVDITFDVWLDGQPSAAFLGIRGTEYIVTKGHQLPVLMPVCIILKKLLSLHDLNKPFSGGMSSFTLILMVSAFLRSSAPYESPGKCLWSILNYYGNVFDCTKMSIVNDLIVAIGRGEPLPGLLVANPLQPEMNAAYNVTRFDKIKECFRNAYGVLDNELKQSQHDRPILEMMLKI